MKTPHPIPPQFAKRILLRFLRDDLAEEVSGDLDEKFYSTLKNKSVFKAKINYWYEVFNYLRPFAIRKSKSVHMNRYDMFQSYFRIGWRNLFRNKGYSIINVGGLATGMTVAILIGLWVHDELSANKYFKNYSRIAQVMKAATYEGQYYMGQMHLPFPLVEELESSYNENFRHIVPAWGSTGYILTVGEKKISQTGLFIGEGAPEMFSWNMLQGTWSGLKEPHSIMISESTAKSLFGPADPMDQTVLMGKSTALKVTGIFEDFPKNTAFHGTQIFLPWELCVIRNAWMKDQGWDNHFMFIYAEIKPGMTIESVNANILEAEQRAIKDLAYMQGEVKYNPEILLHPMSDWHLRSNFKEGKLEIGPIQFIWFIGLIGGFVLLLACINFMNLSTARSEKRAREVGIRKAIGSYRAQLINQFFSESFLVVTMAFVLAVLFAALAMPSFNDLSSKEVSLPWLNPSFWLISVAFILFTGILAGSYPALYLSSFNPVKALKGTFMPGRFASAPRKVLVVLQFSVSVILIISTVVVYNQIMYAKDRPVGYQRSGLLMVQKKTDEFFKKLDVLRGELKNTGAVFEVAESGKITEIWSGNGGFNWAGKDPEFEAHFATLAISPEFGRTVGWQFTDGRDFSEEFASDSSGFVINEAAAKYMGLQNPVGETLHWKNRAYNVDKDFKILGVMKDMVMASPFEPAKPSVFFIQGWKGWLNIRINPSVSTSDALPRIEDVFKKVIPSAPFDFKFADEEYALKFAAEERIGKLASVFSALAIFISCLGLFGLASFTAEQRTKEIGIRKVVGASVASLWRLLSKDFILLVLIACAIAIPLAYIILNSWLENYTYRTEISIWVFVLVSGGAVAITLSTVSYQAVKAALMNPVNSLKTE